MPSQPLDPGWGFASAIDLIDSGVQDTSSPRLTPKSRPQASIHQTDGGIRLGNFAKLYENLRLAQDAPALPSLDSESELSSSDGTLLPSPIPKPAQLLAEEIEPEERLAAVAAAALSKKQRQKARRRAEKEQQDELLKSESFKQELESLADAAREIRKTAVLQPPTKASRTHSQSNVGAKIRAVSPVHVRSAPVPAAASISPKKAKTYRLPHPTTISERPSTLRATTPPPAQAVETIQVEQVTPDQLQFSTFGTPALTQYPQYSQLPLQSLQTITPTGQHGLIPHNVRPVTLPRSSQRAVAEMPLTPTLAVHSFSIHDIPTNPRAAFTIRSQVDRHFHLFQKLLNRFPDDRKWLVSPMQLINEKTAAHGLHVFVDASNIMIGFKDMLRYHGIQPHQYDMSFDSLALVMERRRPVAKRVFAGSQREANPLPHVTKLVETSKAVGYDSVMQEQVLIVREESEKKKFFHDVKKHGWHKATQLRAGSGSDSETGPAPALKRPSAPKWVEQGVDEILHLKMCQSIIDTDEPGMMVLATGDGAEAEMSDGFLAHVERALKKGWKVELISWRQQTNGGYKNKKFRAKWAEQFQIIELDDFLEDLIDTL